MDIKKYHVAAMSSLILLLCIMTLQRLSKGIVTIDGVFGNSKPEENRISIERDRRYERPRCDNILHNITKGRWIKKIEILKEAKHLSEINRLKKTEKDIDQLLKIFWKKRGIGSSFVNEKRECGYHAYQTQPTGTDWPRVGSWCDKNSRTPCCTNINKGRCMPRTPLNCKCKKCVDMAEYVHAEVGQWETSDPNCKWTNFTAEQACSTMVDSPIDDFYFVGDSITRNFVQALEMILKGDTIRGHWFHKRHKVPNECFGPERFFWPACRGTQNWNGTIACDGEGRNRFNISRPAFISEAYAKDFADLMLRLAGKRNTLVVLSVGVHFGYKFTTLLKYYLQPAIDINSDYYSHKDGKHNDVSNRWPKLMMFSTQNVGLLKPPIHLYVQSQERNLKFHAETQEFCVKHDIPFLNFMPLTDKILSFDGTHYGLAVNIMKAQMFLNYLSTL